MNETEKVPCPRCGKADWHICREPTLAATQQAKPATGQQDQASDERMPNKLRDWLEGMSVSMDVSTGEHDAHHRYFGKISEVMDCSGDKHGVTLLVYNAKPNFKVGKSSAPAPKASGATEPVVYMRQYDIDNRRPGTDMAAVSWVKHDDWNVAMRASPAATEASGATVPEGYAIVPRQPTPEMVEAFAGQLRYACGSFFEWESGGDEAYAALIAAAPAAPEQMEGK